MLPNDYDIELDKRAVHAASKLPPFDNGGFICAGRCEPVLREPPTREQVELCKEWILSRCRKRKTINPSHSSYGFKHRVEASTRAPDGAREYIPNGAFIQAALELGYIVKQIRGGPNATFNMCGATRHWLRDEPRRGHR